MSRHPNLAWKFFSLIFVLLAGLSISSAAPQDSSRAAAEKLIAEAKALTEKRTEQSYEQAIEKYRAAVSIWRSLNDKSMEATTLYEAGWLYGDIGQYQKALDCYSQALTRYKALGNQQSETDTLNNTAWIYSELGDEQTAFDMYFQVVEDNKKLGRTDPAAISNLASSYATLGDYQRALELHLQLLKLRQGTSDNAGLSITLSNIGNSYYHLGDLTKALDYYSQSLPLMRKVGNNYYTAAVLNHTGVAYRSLGQYEKALGYFNEALALRRLAGDQRGIATTFSDIACLERDRGNLLEARKWIEEALAQIEIVRLKVASPLLRSSFFASVQKYREFYIDLLMSLDKDNPSEQLDRVAFNAAETGRARSLLQLLAEAGNNIHHDSTPQFTALVQPVPLKLEEIQQKILDRDTLLLEYSLGEERSFVWAITPDSIKTFELPKRAVIESAARRVYELLTARTAEYANASSILSRMVLGPVAAELKDKRLLIISDGVLQYIPFAGLPDPAVTDSRALVVDHEVVFAPSASVVGLLRQETANRKPASKLVAVLGDPVFSGDDPRVAAAKPRRTLLTDKDTRPALRSSEPDADGFRRLRFSRQEADEIARLAGSDAKLEAVDFAANRNLAMSPELGQYRVIHFATHAVINNSHPELSGIVLSLVDEKGKPQNGFLRLYDLYNLKLSADLVVLSACQTALGKEIRGEGLVGLTRGFMYAGAPRVVASLWQIDDRASAEFMKRFYEAMLRQKLRPAAALRAAQISMSQDPRWHEPHYWAAFTLQGEWN